MRTSRTAALVLAAGLALAGCGDDGGTDEGAASGSASGTAEASVTLAGVEDGATVSSPVAVSFEAEGFDIIPAAEGGGDGAGHMHVIVDAGCVPVGETIPADEQHLHFGDGATEAELELEPGEHTLCLQAGDGEHTAMDVTDEVTVTVE